MPVMIKATAIPQSILKMKPRLLAALTEYAEVLINDTARTEIEAVHDETLIMYAELYEALDLQPVLDNPIVSIQVQTTRLTGAGVEVVPFKSGTATHWSIYTRNAIGITTWVEDVSLGCAHADTLFGSVMVKAAKLSMEHQAFIEQVK